MSKLISRLRDAAEWGTHEPGDLREVLEVLLLVKAAREAGWYEEDSRWEPIDKALGIGNRAPEPPSDQS